MARIAVQTENFDTGAEISALTAGRTDIGGIGCFIGTVRDQPGPKGDPATPPVVAMTLEHYPGMTERAISRIVAEAEGRWPLLGCTVIHRVGRLAVGENIVLVVAASSHRQAALDATAFLIDWLKTRAPFWKREEFANGHGAWVEA
ncbi:MAG: molybdenum cofactor biosynthesis protein MoaE, partial [Acetobacteraceae bacterium]